MEEFFTVPIGSARQNIKDTHPLNQLCEGRFYVISHTPEKSIGAMEGDVGVISFETVPKTTFAAAVSHVRCCSLPTTTTALAHDKQTNKQTYLPGGTAVRGDDVYDRWPWRLDAWTD